MESGGEERSGEPWALRMSGDPGRESLAGAQRGAEGRRRRRWLKLHGYVRTLTFTQPPNICCCLLTLHHSLPPSLAPRALLEESWEDEKVAGQLRGRNIQRKSLSGLRFATAGPEPHIHICFPIFFCGCRSFNRSRNQMISGFIGFGRIVTNEQGGEGHLLTVR